MSIQDFHHLAARFCGEAGVALPELAPEADGTLAFTIVVNDVAISVSHDPWHPDHAFVTAEFGPLPPGGELQAACRLLHSNLLMRGPQGPAFGIEPESGQVLLQYAFPLATLDSTRLLAGLDTLVEGALKWRGERFFEPSCGAMPVAALRDMGDFA